jgi:PIN like domain
LKVAFDENVPTAMVRVFETFANERQLKRKIGSFQIVSAREFVPKQDDTDYRKKDDSPWIKRFAEAAGRAIISGDTRMRFVPHERLALIQHGMLVFFFDTKWNQWEFFRKCSLLIHHWPAIAKRIKIGKAPAFWYIPLSWAETAKLRKVPTDDPRQLKIERQQKARRAHVRKKAVPKKEILAPIVHEPNLLDLMIVPKKES